MGNSKTKRSAQIAVRMDGETKDRLDKLVSDHPVGSLSSFTLQAIKLGLPKLEAIYGPQPEEPAKQPLANPKGKMTA